MSNKTYAVLVEITHERLRQIEQEGFTAEHDADHDCGELAAAGAAYALAGSFSSGWQASHPPLVWPWKAEWWKPKDRRRDLIRAAALLVAEIERLDRNAASTSTGA